MENKKSGHISEKELDSLLNEAFLNLDFENNSKNKEVLAIVSKQAMRKNSLFANFNVRWFNLLFLLLSLSVCLASFYRYMDRLSNEESNNVNPLPGTDVIEKKTPVNVPPTTKYSGKSTKERLAENIPVSITTPNVAPEKNKFELGDKKKRKKFNSAIVTKINPVDSVSKVTEPDPEIKSTDPLSGIASVDSSVVASQKKRITSSTNQQASSDNQRAAKKVKPVKPNNKVKVGKRRKARIFGGSGRVKLKGRKYLKTSRH